LAAAARAPSTREATDDLLGRVVALKVLHRKPGDSDEANRSRPLWRTRHDFNALQPLLQTPSHLVHPDVIAISSPMLP
jgi:hypothetical protein